ncbi:MAG: DsbA family protein [Acidimicrobiia bacterium]
MHGNSAYAASLLEGAREQHKYWELMDVFFGRHPEWASHDAPRPDLLATFAMQLGLDMGRLKAASFGADVAERIRQDTSDGNALGANRTPTIFVNRMPLLQLGYQPLRAAVVAALQSSSAAM